MSQFQDILIKRKLVATLGVVSTVASLFVAARFAGEELITHPHTLKP